MAAHWVIFEPSALPAQQSIGGINLKAAIIVDRPSRNLARRLGKLGIDYAESKKGKVIVYPRPRRLGVYGIPEVIKDKWYARIIAEECGGLIGRDLGTSTIVCSDQGTPFAPFHINSSEWNNGIQGHFSVWGPVVQIKDKLDPRTETVTLTRHTLNVDHRHHRIFLNNDFLHEIVLNPKEEINLAGKLFKYSGAINAARLKSRHENCKTLYFPPLKQVGAPASRNRT